MLRLAALALLSLGQIGDASARQTDADPLLIDAGRYLAVAGDCAGCHGDKLAGGDPVASPLGKIFASNITPDRSTGIGRWSLGEFSDLLRKGRAPDHHIFPAMPYTSYTGLSDAQIKALYSYLMLGVAPVHKATPETHLPFPFVRPAMIAWNLLNLDEGHATGSKAALGEQQQHGRLLVETLGHCTACHTPRGVTMGQQQDRHLGGAFVGGWWAPNITPAGLHDWSDAQLATFLRTGHIDVAVAGGEMGTVVSRSLSRLPAADIDTIIAYLRVVPPVALARPATRLSQPAPAIQVTALEPVAAGWQASLRHDTTDGAVVYQSACASCHGSDGNGSAGLQHPSLRRVSSVTMPRGATMVQVIAGGVHRTVNGTTVRMPAFRSSLSDPQIAAVANFVRRQFGGVESTVTDGDVATILDGQVGVPWLIRNATWLAIGGFVVVAGLLVWLTMAMRRSSQRRSAL